MNQEKMTINRINGFNYLTYKTKRTDNELFELEVLKNNKIYGLLEAMTVNKENEIIINYLISSKQSIKEYYRCKSASLNEYKKLIKNIIYIYRNIFEYFLDGDNIVLDINYAYIDLSDTEICLYLPYIPGNGINFDKCFREFVIELSEYLEKSDTQNILFIHKLRALLDFDQLDFNKILMAADDEESLKPDNKNCDRDIVTELEDKLNDLYNIKEIDEKNKNDTDFFFRGLFSKKKKHKNGEINSKEYGIQIIQNNNVEDRHEFMKPNDDIASTWEQYKNTIKSFPEKEVNHTVLLEDYSENGELKVLRSLNDFENDILIDKFPFVVGRHRQLCDYVVDRDNVSRMHFKIIKDYGKYYIKDMNSLNGVFVNGKRLNMDETYEIKTGEKLEFANLKFVFN